MMADHWHLVYGRPSLSKDAVLFSLALALHAPLLLLQFKAPLKPTEQKDPSYLIRMQDDTINRILREGILLPPPPLGVSKPHLIDLSRLVITNPLPPPTPVAPPPLRLNLSNGAPVTKIPDALATIQRGEGPMASYLGGGISVGGGGLSLVDKGTLSTALPGGIESIETGAGRLSTGLDGKTIHIAAGPAPALAPPTEITPSALAKISKSFLPELPSREILPSKSTLAADKTAGKAIDLQKSASAEDPDLPIFRPLPRDLTPGERQKELFPIHGALKDRAVLRQESPEFPEWARKKGVEASVKLRFSVTRDGRVNENIEILSGSGYPELDENARSALLRWIFDRLPLEKGNIVQDGIIEFRFTIK